MNYNFKFKFLMFLFLFFFLFFVFVDKTKAFIVRDCSYFEVEGYDNNGNLISTPANVRSLNNNTAVIYTPIGSYIRTRVKSFWFETVPPPTRQDLVQPPRGILYEDGRYYLAYPNPSREIFFDRSSSFVLARTSLMQYLNNRIIGNCWYYSSYWRYDTSPDHYGDFCTTTNNVFTTVRSPWEDITGIDDNLKEWRFEPPSLSEFLSYVEHVKGKLSWRQLARNDHARVFENSFQVTERSTYTVATSVSITSSGGPSYVDPTEPAWFCQDGRHPRFAVDENGNSVGFSNGHSWNDCNVCRVFINPSGCEISGPNSVSVDTSNPYSVRSSTLAPEEVVNSLRVYVGKKSCVDDTPLDPLCWESVYDVDGRSGSFSHAFRESGAYYMICNASNNNLSQFYNGFWCSGHPSETFLSRQGVPSCGPNSNLLVNVNVNESSCSLSLFVSNNFINQGESTTVRADVTINGSASLSLVSFASSNDVLGLCSTATLNSSCSSNSYSSFSSSSSNSAKIVGLKVGSSNITALARLSNGVTCEATLSPGVTVLALPPWYQVVNGGISVGSVLEEGVSRPGIITAQLPLSSVCSTCYLLAGTFKGLPVANRINVGLDRLSSSPIWNVQGLVLPSSLNRNFGFYYDKVSGVLSRIMNPIDPGTIILARNMNSYANWSSGVEYYFYDNNNPLIEEVTLDVSGFNVPIGRKIVLFVRGARLRVVGNLPPASVNGFFMIVSQLDISFEPSVQNFTGLVHTDGSLRTGTRFPSMDEQINIVGAVYANKLILERNLVSGNISQPAEVFTYSPSLVMQYPSQLSEKNVTWREVDN